MRQTLVIQLRYLSLALLLTLLAVPMAYADSLADFVRAAKARTEHQITYDGSYYAIEYPMGDVPAEIGVCTDLVIRAYRAVGVDLQVQVHEDMRAAFARYPKLWGLRRPDRNIDHRRVPNLRVFFSRHGQALPISNDPSDYQPGHLVTWRLPGNRPHIGVVSDENVPGTDRPYIVHNIGRGPSQDDMLFVFEITGHYRYEKPD